MVSIDRPLPVHHRYAFRFVVFLWSTFLWLGKRRLSLERNQLSPPICNYAIYFWRLLLFVPLFGQLDHLLDFEFSYLLVELGLIEKVPKLFEGVFLKKGRLRLGVDEALRRIDFFRCCLDLHSSARFITTNKLNFY